MSKTMNRGNYTTPEGSATWEYIAALSCALIIFGVGIVNGWTAPSLQKLRDLDSPISLTAEEVSTLASMVPLGTVVAPLLTMVLNRFGRKIILYAASVPVIVGFGLIIVAEDTSVLFAARFICGFAAGLGLCSVPMYLGEVSSARLRGSLGIACATMLNAGLLFMMILVPQLSIRMSACVCFSIAIISTLCIWFIPESPYSLAMHGKFDEAEGALEKLRGKTDVTEELNLIKETVGRKDKVADGSKEEGKQESRESFSTLKRLFMVSGNRKALIINLFFVLVIQLGGYVTIMIYGFIIIDAMQSGLSVHVCMTVGSVFKTSCPIVTGFIIDKVGRRPLIVISGIGSCVCLFTVGIYFYLMEYTDFDVTPYRLVGPFALLILVISINTGIVPVSLVVLSETFDTDVKALATCLLGIFTGVMSSIGLKSYLLLAVVWDLGHSVPFFILFAITSTGVIFIVKLLPETKGKTLLQIQKDLSVSGLSPSEHSPNC